jgi:hypothetical protein
LVADVAKPRELVDDGGRVIEHEPADVPELKPAVAVERLVTIVLWDKASLLAHVVRCDATEVCDVE